MKTHHIAHRRAGATLIAALASGSAQPVILDGYTKDAATAVTVRDEAVPIAYGGRAAPGGKTYRAERAAPGGKTYRAERKRLAKAMGKELMEANAAQLDVRYIHPRWLRELVTKLLDAGLPVTEGDMAAYKAAGKVQALRDAERKVLGHG